MDKVQHRARFDWLVELGGASALAGAAGYAALKAAPTFAMPAPSAMIASGVAFFGLGMAAMRSVRTAPREHLLPVLNATPIGDDELMLEDRVEEPLLLEDIHDDGVLLLQDALGRPSAASRVVQLFAGAPMPTAGELKDRIDRHLAGASRDIRTGMPPPDASEALYAALADLKRSLR